ncbi:unnamed protein product, partial [Meganyctiphanes norvegica]
SVSDGNYDWSYDIRSDDDRKYHRESRTGDKVVGEYRVREADGTIRVVTYTADAKHGFQAKVEYENEDGEKVDDPNTRATNPWKYNPLNSQMKSANNINRLPHKQSNTGLKFRNTPKTFEFAGQGNLDAPKPLTSSQGNNPFNSFLSGAGAQEDMALFVSSGNAPNQNSLSNQNNRQNQFLSVTHPASRTDIKLHAFQQNFREPLGNLEEPSFIQSDYQSNTFNGHAYSRPSDVSSNLNDRSPNQRLNQNRIQTLNFAQPQNQVGYQALNQNRNPIQEIDSAGKFGNSFSQANVQGNNPFIGEIQEQPKQTIRQPSLNIRNKYSNQAINQDQIGGINPSLSNSRLNRPSVLLSEGNQKFEGPSINQYKTIREIRERITGKINSNQESNQVTNQDQHSRLHPSLSNSRFNKPSVVLGNTNKQSETSATNQFKPNDQSRVRITSNINFNQEIGIPNAFSHNNPNSHQSRFHSSNENNEYTKFKNENIVEKDVSSNLHQRQFTNNFQNINEQRQQNGNLRSESTFKPFNQIQTQFQDFENSPNQFNEPRNQYQLPINQNNEESHTGFQPNLQTDGHLNKPLNTFTRKFSNEFEENQPGNYQVRLIEDRKPFNQIRG